MTGIRRTALVVGVGFAAVAAVATVTLVARARRAPCPTWTTRSGGACVDRAWTPSVTLDVEAPGLELAGLGVDAAGHGIAAWQVSTPGHTSVGIGEERAPGSWVSRSPTTHLEGNEVAPVLAVGSAGEALVTWLHAGEGGGVLTSERDPRGSWRDTTEPLSFGPSVVEPTAAIGPTGEQAIAWCQLDGQTWGISVATRSGPTASWVRPSGSGDLVSPRILFANQPQIAIGKSDAIVAWYQSEGAPLMAYVSERHAGVFSHPEPKDHLSPLGGPVASDPVANVKPAIGPRGEAAVVWIQESGDTSRVYLATREPDGPWTVPRDLEDSFSHAPEVARNARVAFAADGTLFVVWMQREGASWSILAARRDPKGQWLTTGRDPMRLSSAPVAYDPVIATGPDGGVIVGWIEEDGPHEQRIAARRTGTDRTDWSPVEWLTPTHGGHLASLRAAIGPRDRTLVGWVSGLKPMRLTFARMEAR